MFVGDGYQFDLVDDPVAMSSLNIFNYLQGKVAGLQVEYFFESAFFAMERRGSCIIS